MSFEIEKKYRIAEEDRDHLAKALAELGAEFVGREFEENIIFSSPALRENGAVVRIRKTESRSLLTYKRRVESESDVKKQIEHEVRVSDAEVTASILNDIGLRPHLIYEKYRDTWKFRSVEIVLDELPFGLFMEIEGSITGIKEVELLLEIEHLPTEHQTYPLLTAQLGKKVGDVVEARFT